MDLLPYIQVSESNASFRDEYIANINDDVGALLSKQWKPFWETVTTSSKFLAFFESYLRLCPRPYTTVVNNVSTSTTTFTSILTPVEKELQHRVFRLCLRLSTPKEGQREGGVTEVLFGNTIYDRGIYDISRILDVCAVYGQENTVLTGKMIHSLFSCQPKYISDLESAAPVIVDTLDQMQTVATEWDSFTPPSDSEAKDWFVRMVDYAYTIDILIRVHNPITSILQFCEFAHRLSVFYERAYTAMFRIVNLLDDPALEILWEQSARQVLQTLHTYATAMFVQPLTSSKSAGDNSIANEYCDFLDDLLYQRVCFTHYNRYFEVLSEMFSISSTSPLPRLESLISRAVGNEEMLYTTHIPEEVQPAKQQSGKGIVDTEKDSVLRAQIASITDVIPGLGEGFVAQLLEYNNFDVEKSIDMLLSDELPKRLAKADREQSWSSYSSQQEPTAKLISEKGKGKEADKDLHYNIQYERGFNMKLDDGTLMYRGKRNKTSDMTSYAKPDQDMAALTKAAVSAQLEREEAAREAMREAREAGQKTVDMRVYKGAKFDEYDLYDDEYDDTFDSLVVGANDDDGDSIRIADKKAGKNNSQIHENANSDTNINIQPVSNYQARQKGEGRESNAVSGHARGRNNSRGVGRGRGVISNDGAKGKFDNYSGRSTATTTANVRGKGRGMGGGAGEGEKKEPSDKDKAYRDKNKSRFGNHNRKAGSDKKMRAGMN
eukprot:CFRG8385T1